MNRRAVTGVLVPDAPLAERPLREVTASTGEDASAPPAFPFPPVDTAIVAAAVVLLLEVAGTGLAARVGSVRGEGDRETLDAERGEADDDDDDDVDDDSLPLAPGTAGVVAADSGLRAREGAEGRWGA